MTVTLFELAGVTTAQGFAAHWPVDRIRWQNGDYDEAGVTPLIQHLNDVLRFSNVLTGAAPDGDKAAVGITADVEVLMQNATGGPHAAVHRHLPDFALNLVSTDGTRPAKLVWTGYANGEWELAIVGLPVELALPNDMLYAPETDTTTGEFNAANPDSLLVQLPADLIGPARLTFFATLRVTRAREVLLTPTVPLSIGRCVFMGLPARAVHDIAFYPDLPADAVNSRGVFTGWAQEDAESVLRSRAGAATGVVTVRTIELDRSNDAVRTVYDWLGTNTQPDPPAVEIPIEDVAVVFDGEGGIPLPAYPVYGLTGIRRLVTDDTDAAEPFDHTLAPMVLPVGSLRIHIHRLLIGWTEDPVVNFDIAVPVDDSTNPEVGAVTVNLTEDWKVLGGYAFATPKKLFKVGNAKLSLLAARGGPNLRKLVFSEGEPRYKVWKWLDALMDLGLVSSEQTEDQIAFTTRSGGNLDLVLRDVGWKDGKPSINVWIPDGLKLGVLQTAGFDIDEIGVATTIEGASYLKISASYRVGYRDRVATGAPDSPQHPPGDGIWIRGLRFRLQAFADADKPQLAIDGIVLSIRASDGAVIEGGGWLRDEIVGGNRIRELGFGIRIYTKVGNTEYAFGGLLVKGSIEIANVTTDYLLAGVTVGPIPLGSFTLLKGSILVAQNYVPRLPAPTGVEQNLRQYQWYRSQPNGLELPIGRVLSAWEPKPDSWVVGIGLRLGLGNCGIIKLDAFALWQRNPETWSLLIGLELRFKTQPQPIGWLAVDYDNGSGRWGATGGIAIGVRNILDDDRLPAIAEVTGAVFLANEPRTIALGHIEDVDTWPQFKVAYERFHLLLRIGFCFYDYEGDPPVDGAIGLVVTGRGDFDLKALQFKFLLEFAVRLGSFSSDGHTVGAVASLEAAIAVKIWRIRFGLRSKIQVQSIRPEPESGSATLDFTIETPWWLPDLHISHTWRFGGDPEIAAAPVVSMPVSGAKALGLSAGTTVDLPTPLPAGADDAGRPYSLAQLEQLGPPAPGAEVFDGLVPVPVDSVIAIDFAATMTDGLGTGETTPLAASRQTNGELWCDYEVVEIGIRRRPRYGADAGVWSTLIAPESTSTAAIDPVSQTVAELVAAFTSEISLRWDRDVVRSGQLAARRLLVNAATPFSLTTANPIADEALLDDTAATCCGRKPELPWRRLTFDSATPGTRVPTVTAFPGGAAHVRWHTTPPPVVTIVESDHAARIPLTGLTGTTLFTVRFDRPASRFWIRLLWSSPMPLAVRVELHRGLTRLTHHDVVLGTQQVEPVEVHDGQGADRAVVRVIGTGGLLPLGALYVDAIAYIGRAELTNWLMGIVHCANGGTLPGGTLAWMPNHDYEVSITCATTVGHDRVGSASVPVHQAALFRTKGWPGLNAPKTPGGDLLPFVEACYPSRVEQPLYRDEPILLVMNERFAPLAPVVDAPPSAPPERRQLLEWSMLVDRVGVGDRGAVATYPSADWLSTHRQPTGPAGPRSSRADAVASWVRSATSLDPRMQRLDGVRRSPANCQPTDPSLHSSRIFSCEPPQGGWAHGGYRTRIVPRHGPYVMRTEFEHADTTALRMLADGGPPGPWTVDAGSLVAPHGAQRSWAVFGQPSWLHTRIEADFVTSGADVGLAVAVGGPGGHGDALVAVVGSSRLRLERRRAGVHQLLAEADIGVADTVRLELVGYDDEIVATVGQIEVRAPRLDQREGRVAVVAGGGARVTRLVVEPVTAYAFDVATSQWRTFEDHIAAYADRRPLALPVTATELSGWLSSTWDDIAAVMTPAADPQRRATVFRAAQETLGIPTVEEPTQPTATRLQVDGASAMILLESPEPLPLSHDVTITMQRRRRRRPPFPHPRPLPGEPVVMARRPIVTDPVVDIDDLVLDPFPSDITQWDDVETFALTDETERRALLVPVTASTRTPLVIAAQQVRVRFDLDRERYRSAEGDPQSRSRASVTRVADW